MNFLDLLHNCQHYMSVGAVDQQVIAKPALLLFMYSQGGSVVDLYDATSSGSSGTGPVSLQFNANGAPALPFCPTPFSTGIWVETIGASQRIFLGYILTP